MANIKSKQSMRQTLGSFSERFNIALDDFGVPPKNKGRQQMVAKMFDVSNESARKWLSAESFPQTLKILRIAEQLSVNPTWLLSGQGSMYPLAEVRQLPNINTDGWKEVPSLTWQEAAHLCDDYFEGSTHKREWLWTDCEIGPRAFALTVKDDAMEPRFLVGASLIIDPDFEVGHKNNVVVHFHETDEVTCRQFLIDGVNRYLKCNNKDYHLILFAEATMSLHGVVRQMRYQY